MLEKILDDFNKFFEGKAKAVIVNGQLEITVGSLTMIIVLSHHIGGRNDPMV
jgi:hypothetical protein